MAYANISSLHVFDLLPPSRDAAVTGLLRSDHLPVWTTRTTRYRSFIPHGFYPLRTKVMTNHLSFHNHKLAVLKTVYGSSCYYRF